MFSTLPRRRVWLALLAAAVVSTTSCGMLMTMMHGSKPVPPASEFGLGPRASASGALRASIETTAPLRVGKMQSVRVHFVDRDGSPVKLSAVSIDGGMPQHGHGLPTKPRVNALADAGEYTVDGIRFNMGGWWEVRFKVVAAAGVDSVTFNIKL